MKTTHSVMGMPITVLIVSDDDLLANNATEAAFEEFYETERTYVQGLDLIYEVSSTALL